MKLDLPSTAIGKDYLGDSRCLDVSGAGDGWQFSAAGLASIAVSPTVGLELNLLGVNLEFDLDHPAIELPAYGQIGASNVSPASAKMCASPATLDAGMQKS